jgi:hypothetical protein
MITRASLAAAMLLALSAFPASASCLGSSDFWGCRARERDESIRELDREQRDSDRAYERRQQERREEAREQEREEARERHERRQEQQADEIIEKLDRLRRVR